MKTKYFYILLFISTYFSVSEVKGQDYLDNYLKIAAENNPELKARFNQYLAKLEIVSQVGTLPDPQVMFGIFIQPVETRVGAQKANISVTQAFPWFGTLGAQKDAATSMAKSEFEKFEDAKLALFNEVKTTYYNLYYLQKATDIARENLDLLESFRELTKVSFESGKSGFVDVLRVEMEWEDLHNNFLYLEDSKEPLETKFEELLNVPVEQPISFPDTLWTENIAVPKDTLIGNILTNSPKLKQLTLESDSYLNQIKASRKMSLPSFTLGFNYINISPRTDMEVPGNGKDAFLFPQISIRIPLYQSKYKSMIKENELKQEAVNFSRENTENKLTTELEKVYRDYIDAQRRVALYKKQEGYADQSMSLLTTAYSTEGKNFEEVIRMERRLLSYSLELEKARVEQNAFAAYINYLMGK